MTKAPSKLTSKRSKDNNILIHVPLNRLLPSPKNVRKTGGASITELAASIQAHGLIHNLTVIAANKAGYYEVTAGGRRLRALKQLAESGVMAKDAPIRVRVIESADSAEISLAENIIRNSMHPADEFSAFFALANEGKTLSEIAARFGVTELFVKQRLKLAQVAPPLLDTFRDGKMTLEQVMALTITDDHEAQVSAWKNAGYYRHPEDLRRALTAQAVKAKEDRRVRYVTLAAYEKAGGAVRRDLFSDDCWIEDVALLDQLTQAKLAKKVEAIKKEGWGWVELRLSHDHSELRSYSQLQPSLRAPSKKEAAKIGELEQTMESCGKALDDESLSEEDHERLEAQYEAAEKALQRIAGARVVDDPAARGHAGAFVILTHSGNVEVERGLVRREDRKALRTAQPNNQPDAEAEREADAVESTGISDALTRRLTVERTRALRAAVGGAPNVALVVLVHALVLREFYSDNDTPLDITIGSRTELGSGGDATAAGQAIAVRYAGLKSALPSDEGGVWKWAIKQTSEVLLTYLAHCVSEGINTVLDRADSAATWSGRPRGAADQLVQWMGFDMADWWSANADSYLGSVSKAMLVEAVREAKGDESAEPLAKLKKKDAIAAAELALEGTRWLPPLLRSGK